jgi:outer membrane protein OmpA-like peptidoglycan-associated protein
MDAMQYRRRVFTGAWANEGVSSGVPFSSRWMIIVPALALAVSAHAQAPTIRPIDGLIMTGVVHEERGDIESTYGISSVTPTTYEFDISSFIPSSTDTSKIVHGSISRTVRFADDSGAHRVNIIFVTDDPPIFPGSTIDLSKAMLAELKSTGKTSAIVADLPPGAFKSVIAAFGTVRHYYRGDLTRVGTTSISVIVDNKATMLPAIESRGHLTVGGETDDVDIFTFDNPDWPLTLKWSSQGRLFQLTEIEFPAKGTEQHGPGLKGHLAAMSADLKKACRTEIHGIHFAFGSAALTPESDPTLGEIAQLMADNPTWAVTIEGHTDSIGTRASNLDLSKRRAAAVVNALVTRYHVSAARLSSAGFGDTRPVAPNSTIEGRARNRRVELARQC